MAQRSPSHSSNTSSLTDLDMEMQSPNSPEQTAPQIISNSFSSIPVYAERDNAEQEAAMNLNSQATIPDSEAEQSDKDTDDLDNTSYHSEHNDDHKEHSQNPEGTSLHETSVDELPNTVPQAHTVNVYMARKHARLITHEYLDHLEELHIRNDKHAAFWIVFNGFARNQRWARLMKSIPGVAYQRDAFSNLSGTFTNHEVCRLLARGFYKNHARKIWQGNAAGGRVWQQAGFTLHHRQDKEEILNRLHEFFFSMRMKAWIWPSQGEKEAAGNEDAGRKVAEGRGDEIVVRFINKVRRQVWGAPAVVRNGAYQPITNFGGPALPSEME